MEETITKEMKVQIIEAKLHKKLEGETLRLGIIEKMKPTKMPAWFKEWSENVYAKDINRINDRLDKHDLEFEKINKRLDQNNLKPLVE